MFRSFCLIATVAAFGVVTWAPAQASTPNVDWIYRILCKHPTAAAKPYCAPYL